MGEYAINTEYLARFDKLIESGLSNFHVILSQKKNSIANTKMKMKTIETCKTDYDANVFGGRMAPIVFIAQIYLHRSMPYQYDVKW